MAGSIISEWFKNRNGLRLQTRREAAFGTTARRGSALVYAAGAGARWHGVEPLESRVMLAASSITNLADMPVAAQQPISSAIGQDQAVYHMASDAAGVTLVNPANGFNAQVQAGVLQVSAGSDTWNMTLAGLGYGGMMQAVETALTSTNGNRVDLNYGTIDEWYINGPSGLEQGFTVSPLTQPETTGSLTVELALGGDLTATVNAAGNGLSLSRPNGSAVLSYTGLAVNDATGKALAASLEVQTENGHQELLIHVNDAGALGPITIDPFVQQAKLTVPDAAQDFFGASVSIDGNVVVVGAPGAFGEQGAAYVFSESDAGWASLTQPLTQTAQLIASDGAEGDDFGYSISISGNTVVVGAPWATVDGNSQQGAAYVFTEPSAGWAGKLIQNAKLTASDGTTGANFGSSISISGNTVLVGADQDHTGESRLGPGEAYVFTEPESGWADMTQTAELTSSDGETLSQFGFSVAINGDTAVVGGTLARVGNNGIQGAAYVFSEPESGWENMTQTARLNASDGVGGDLFGSAVAISGNIIVVGAKGATVGDNDIQGAAYVFTEPGTGWVDMTQTAKLITPDDFADEFGESISISGSTVVVGAEWNNDDNDVGYLFSEPGSGWASLTQPLTPTATLGNEDGDSFGGVSISGGTVVIGATGTNTDFYPLGEAYVYTEPVSGWSGNLAQPAELVDYDPQPGEFGYSVAVSGNTLVVGAPEAFFGDKFQEGAAYVFTTSGSGFVQTGTLIASDGRLYEGFGYSVAISGNTIVVGGPGALPGSLGGVDGSDLGPGAAYVYVEPVSGWASLTQPMTQTAELTASDGNLHPPSGGNEFGDSVSISGNTVVVGAATAGPAEFDWPGAAYVFTEPAGGWAGNLTETAKLTAADGVNGDGFGSSVSISGNTLVVGAAYATIGDNNQGAAYVFTESDSIWTWAAKLIASDGALGEGDAFGAAVAISGDTVVVGAPAATITTTGGPGAAYVFTKPTDGWAGNLFQTAKLTASDGAAYDNFGDSVSIDGATVAVNAWGAGRDNDAAYVFVEPAAGWVGNLTQTTELKGSDVTTLWFGGITVSGSTVVVGSDSQPDDPGAAYVFGVGIAPTNPNTPTNGNPSDNAPGVSLTPTLQASAFSDSDGESQTAAEWVITRVSDETVILDSGTDTKDLTSFVVPFGDLTDSMAYSWQVRYENGSGQWSSYSTATTFTTQTGPAPGSLANDTLILAETADFTQALAPDLLTLTFAASGNTFSAQDLVYGSFERPNYSYTVTSASNATFVDLTDNITVYLIFSTESTGTYYAVNPEDGTQGGVFTLLAPSQQNLAPSSIAGDSVVLNIAGGAGTEYNTSGAETVALHSDGAFNGFVGGSPESNGTYSYTSSVGSTPGVPLVVANDPTAPLAYAYLVFTSATGGTFYNTDANNSNNLTDFNYGTFALSQTIPGDVNNDGQVDINDLAVLAANWQQSVTPWTNGDLDGSGFVDINDLAILAANWQAGVNSPGEALTATQLAPSLAASANSSTPTPSSVYWTGAGDGVNWSDSRNWSGDALPGANADVFINAAANPTINFTSAAGNVSIHTLTSSDPINLSGGTLTITAALTMNGQHLTLSGGKLIEGSAANPTGGSSPALTGVSEMSGFNPDDVIVSIPDPNLLNAIDTYLDLPDGTPVTDQEMLDINSLAPQSDNIQNLSGLQYATNLVYLALDSNQISDVSPLAGLTNLEELSLEYNQISDVSPLAGLTQLTGLDLENNQISDVSPLADLNQLTSLYLINNQITDVSPLAGLTDLTELSLASNQISDVGPLAGLTNLQAMTLADNQVSNVSPLAGLTQLSELNLDNNQISDVSPLSGLTNLEYLGLTYNYLNINPGSAALNVITALQDNGTQVDYSPQQEITLTPTSLAGDTLIELAGDDPDAVVQIARFASAPNVSVQYVLEGKTTPFTYTYEVTGPTTATLVVTNAGSTFPNTLNFTSTNGGTINGDSDFVLYTTPQNLPPVSVANEALQLQITAGTGTYPSLGNLNFTFSTAGTTYTTAGNLNSTGTSTYTSGLSGVSQGATIAYHDSQLGNGTIFLAFVTPTTGIFYFTNGYESTNSAYGTFNLTSATSPLLASASYFGGSDNEEIEGIAQDSSGNKLIGGWTGSTDLPLATNTNQVGENDDGFVAKFNSSGTLLWSTYIGGSDGWAEVLSIAVDHSGNAYVTGTTGSSDLAGATNSPHGGDDAFVAKISPTGAILWSTYLGGSADDDGIGITLDSSGNAYITGYTYSNDFEGAGGAYGGGQDAFLAKVNSNGATQWATYFGGSGDEAGNGIVVNNAGEILIAGVTSSSDLPNPTNSYHGGASDDFVAEFNSSGTSLWTTYLGGSGTEAFSSYSDDAEGNASIVLDNQGNAFIAGYTESNDIALANNAYHGGGDAVLYKINAAGALQWATYLGGSGQDAGRSLTIDSSGNLFVAGLSDSTDITGAVNANFGNYDALLIRVNPNGAQSWSMDIGGSDIDYADQVILDNSGNAWVVGGTFSTDLAGANNTSPGGNPSEDGEPDDGFLAEVSNIAAPPITPSSLAGDTLVLAGTQAQPNAFTGLTFATSGNTLVLEDFLHAPASQTETANYSYTVTGAATATVVDTTDNITLQLTFSTANSGTCYFIDPNPDDGGNGYAVFTLVTPPAQNYAPTSIAGNTMVWNLAGGGGSVYDTSGMKTIVLHSDDTFSVIVNGSTENSGSYSYTQVIGSTPGIAEIDNPGDTNDDPPSFIYLVFTSKTNGSFYETDATDSNNLNDFAYGTFTLSQTIPGDVNNDGQVDINDLAILAANWQQSVTPWTDGDLDGTGFVDINDLAILAANWQAGTGNSSISENNQVTAPTDSQSVATAAPDSFIPADTAENMGPVAPISTSDVTSTPSVNVTLPVVTAVVPPSPAAIATPSKDAEHPLSRKVFLPAVVVKPASIVPASILMSITPPATLTFTAITIIPAIHKRPPTLPPLTRGTSWHGDRTAHVVQKIDAENGEQLSDSSE